MNLHALVRGPITSVNPDILITYKKSTGFTVDGAGVQTPTYATFTNVAAQIQGYDGDRLIHTEKLNIQGVYRSVHVFGNTQGVVRPNAQGGDLLYFAQSPGGAIQTWLVVRVRETWPDWSRVIVCLQQ